VNAGIDRGHAQLQATVRREEPDLGTDAQLDTVSQHQAGIRELPFDLPSRPGIEDDGDLRVTVTVAELEVHVARSAQAADLAPHPHALAEACPQGLLDRRTELRDGVRR
jgi:hypothetical protein